jgi:hypothetical protein
MAGKVRRVLFGAAVAVLLTAIVPPALFGEAPKYEDRDGGDPWRNFLLDFQTLITGFFAIGAAYVTVWQMRATDNASEKRHRQLVTLSLRADRLRLDRAFSRIWVLRQRVDRMRLPMAGILPTDELHEKCKKVRDISVACGELAEVVRSVRSAVGSQNIQDCFDLFDGSLKSAYEEFNLASGSLDGKLSWVAGMAGSLDPSAKLFNTPLMQRHRAEIFAAVDQDDWTYTFEVFQDATSAFFNAAQRLLDAYRVDDRAHG